MDSEVETVTDQPEARPLTSTLHIVFTLFIIVLGMGFLDGYLVEQNHGSRKTGVCVMLIIGDFCLFLILRYVAASVGTEVRSTKRGSSVIEWFLVIFVLDIKMYFIIEGVRKNCIKSGLLLANPKPLKAASMEVGDVIYNVTNDVDQVAVVEDVPVLNYFASGLVSCEYALTTRKLITLFQAVFISGLYLLLVGADYMSTISDFRSLEELKMRAFWVVVDILDILELQSSMWEVDQSHQLPYVLVAFIYFYCYVVLVVLPPISLVEMSRKEGELGPHLMQMYLMASFCIVNVGSTTIRMVLLLRHSYASTSAIFIGKNVICVGMKVTKLIQLRLEQKGKLVFQEQSDFDGSTNPSIAVQNGEIPAVSTETCNCEDINSKKTDNKALCFGLTPKNNYRCNGEVQDQKPEGHINQCENKRRTTSSDSATIVNATSSYDPHNELMTQQSMNDDGTIRFESNIPAKRMKLKGRRKKKLGEEPGVPSIIFKTDPNSNGPTNMLCKSPTRTILLENEALGLITSKNRNLYHNGESPTAQLVLSPMHSNLSDGWSASTSSRRSHFSPSLDPVPLSFNDDTINGHQSFKSLNDVTVELNEAAAVLSPKPKNSDDVRFRQNLKIHDYASNHRSQMMDQNTSSETDGSHSLPPSMNLLDWTCEHRHSQQNIFESEATSTIMRSPKNQADS
ncbi:uncharacterized protein LOC143462334 [Clavelina lepadiformis]|uniref:uncharacterized protein LOC143462334 n=1 Tax=Clavelina lepadiformis TaxID=159417 RepID=UPI0040431544